MLNGKLLSCHSCGNQYSKAWMLIDALCPSCRVEAIDKGKRKKNIHYATIRYVHIRVKRLDDEHSLTLCNRTLLNARSSTELQNVTCDECLRRYERKLPPRPKTKEELEVEPPL